MEARKSKSYSYLITLSNGSEKLYSDADFWWRTKIWTSLLCWAFSAICVVGRLLHCLNFCVVSKNSANMGFFSRVTDENCGGTHNLEELRKKNCKLRSWLERERCPLANHNNNILPVTEKELFRFMIFSCALHSHFLVHARVFARSFPTKQSMVLLRREVFDMLRAVQSSSKFQKVCHRLISFLTDLHFANDHEVHFFLVNLCNRIQAESLELMARYCHAVSNTFHGNKHRFEAMTASTSIFMRSNSHILTYYLRTAFINGDPYSTSALQMLPWFVGFYCGFDDVDIAAFEVQCETPARNVESLKYLFFENDIHFVPIFSSLGGQEMHDSKQALYWDFALNLCNDFVKKEWPPELMVRAAWALSIGKQYLSKDTFEILMRNQTKPNINFTFYNVQQLLALSISGLVKFTGFDGCMFQLTASEDALFSVHGYMKKPTIKELVDLKLIQQVRSGWFQACNFPGCASRHKGIQIGDRILMVRSTENSLFRATPDQKVG